MKKLLVLALAVAINGPYMQTYCTNWKAAYFFWGIPGGAKCSAVGQRQVSTGPEVTFSAQEYLHPTKAEGYIGTPEENYAGGISLHNRALFNLQLKG